MSFEVDVKMLFESPSEGWGQFWSGFPRIRVLENEHRRNLYGSTSQVRCKLEIRYASQTRQQLENAPHSCMLTSSCADQCRSALFIEHFSTPPTAAGRLVCSAWLQCYCKPTARSASCRSLWRVKCVDPLNTGGTADFLAFVMSPHFQHYQPKESCG